MISCSLLYGLFVPFVENIYYILNVHLIKQAVLSPLIKGFITAPSCNVVYKICLSFD